MTVSADRWTCPHPSCRATVLADDLSRRAAREVLRAAQREHGRRHRAEVEAEVGEVLDQAQP